MGLRSRILGAGMESRFDRFLGGLSLPSGPGDPRLVTEADLEPLPEPARRYLRFAGVVGRPRDWSFRVRFVGSFRLRQGQKPMPCESWQYNTALGPARIYAMRLDVAGLVPMFGTDLYRNATGRMHGKLLGLVTVADGSGPEFDLSELTTYVNDALGFAPSMLLTPAATWSPVDDRSFEVTVADGPLRSTSRVVLDDQDRIVEVSSTDRWADLPTGLTKARWTTPLDGWTERDGRPVPTGGRAIWHLETGPYEYAQGRFVIDSIAFNVPPGPRRGPVSS
jgi:hypothetical protein